MTISSAASQEIVVLRTVEMTGRFSQPPISEIYLYPNIVATSGKRYQTGKIRLCFLGRQRIFSLQHGGRNSVLWCSLLGGLTSSIFSALCMRCSMPDMVDAVLSLIECRVGISRYHRWHKYHSQPITQIVNSSNRILIIFSSSMTPKPWCSLCYQHSNFQKIKLALRTSHASFRIRQYNLALV